MAGGLVDPDGDGRRFVYNLRFPGQYFDKETGLHYNYYRDGYDSSIGGYTQSDPIGLDGGSFSTYSYAGGDPVSYVDPEGLVHTNFSPLENISGIGGVGGGGGGGGGGGRSIGGGASPMRISPPISIPPKVAPGAVKPVAGPSCPVPGSYTNYHQSGKTYSGKGTRERSQKSARREQKTNEDPHVGTDFTPAGSPREAFKQESRRIDENGGVSSSSNYNRRESPGKTYRQQDGER